MFELYSLNRDCLGITFLGCFGAFHPPPPSPSVQLRKVEPGTRQRKALVGVVRDGIGTAWLSIARGLLFKCFDI